MIYLINSDARQIPLADRSVQCIVTSPPYWGLRDYGTAKWEGGNAECDHSPADTSMRRGILSSTLGGGKETTGHQREGYSQICPRCGARRIDAQIGLESTPAAYVAHIVAVMRECWRVLKDDGVLWLNLGDSYARNGGDPGGGNRELLHLEGHQKRMLSVPNGSGLKPKDLCGIPWRVAFALQDDGWVLRSEVIWSKPNPMPESVTDRPTKAHEQVFLFSKAKWIGPNRGRFAYISNDDAKWLALFLDTEGNICAKRAKASSGTDHFGTQICFASTSKALLKRAQSIIDAGTVLRRAGKNAPMYYLQLSNIQAADLLYRIYPFLIVKHRQAQLAIHLQRIISESGRERRTKEGKARGRMRADEYTDELIRIWEAMKSLNHFGDPDLSWLPEVKYGHWDSARYYYDAEAIKEDSVDPIGSAKRYEAPFFVGDKHESGGYSVNGAKHTAGMKEFNGSRNRRSVWTVATQPYSGAHFATFPPALIEPMILAGTSARGECPHCGKAWVRVVETKKPPIDVFTETKKPQDGFVSVNVTDKGMGQKYQDWRNDNPSETIGWRPQCDCPTHEPIPQTVLDPFAGSGTTGAVAIKHGRKAVLLDLNTKYIDLQFERTNGIQITMQV